LCIILEKASPIGEAFSVCALFFAFFHEVSITHQRVEVWNAGSLGLDIGISSQESM